MGWINCKIIEMICYFTKEKRNKSEPNLILITKTHDKVRKERNECMQ